MNEPDEAQTKREGQASDRARPKDKPEQLARGTLVGRYVIVDKLGEGGMGVVYAAFDPELDRKVAIKVLQGTAGGTESGGQAWLLREAQALARLAHPNVVAVHDVGSLPNDQVFVAMELVEGITMRAWLKQRARTWREVLPVMRAAGQGLAAAHRAGLVHRDFKPENVLVGADGRVRVMDFGLARLHGDRDAPASRDSDLSIETRSPLSQDLTLAGHVVGTPAYMAPEIYQESPADARSDQFAFGVTLFEALYGKRPYARAELLHAKDAPPKPRIPSDARVPAALAKLALQAIAIDPAQRFASMDPLISALSRDPFARRRAVLGFAAGVVLVTGAAFGALRLAHSRAPLCEGIEHQLDGVWDAKIKAAVRDAYAATKLPFAPQAYADLERAVDAYAKDWVTTATESCRATRVRGDQSEEVLSLRDACLDQRLAELGAFARIATDPSKSLVEKGGGPVHELQPVARCSNIAALRDEGHPPPDLWPQVKDINKNLADAQAGIVAGNYVSAGAAALRASRLAEQMGFMPVKAQADVMRGLTLAQAQSFDEAIKVLTQGTIAAVIGKRDDIAAHGAFTIAMITAQALGKPNEAKVWITLAKAEARRNGLDQMLEQREAEIEGMVAGIAGDTQTAIASHEKSFAIARQIVGNDDPILWEDEELYAASLMRGQRFDDAIAHFAHAIALRSKVVGADHPDIALLLSNMGACYTRRYDPRARPTLERALAIREKAYGKGNPAIVASVQNLAEAIRVVDHDPAAALPLDERAVKISALLPGKEHPMYHSAATDYAQTLTALGRYADARALLDDTLALEDKTASQEKPETLATRAELALAEQAWADAETYAARSVAAYEAAGGKDDPILWWPLSLLGRAQLALGKHADARASLDRAFAIGEAVHVHANDLAAARAARAKL